MKSPAKLNRDKVRLLRMKLKYALSKQKLDKSNKQTQTLVKKEVTPTSESSDEGKGAETSPSLSSSEGETPAHR